MLTINRCDKNQIMDKWTPYNTAQSLLEVLPGLGRLIASRMRETGEEEATVMQIGVLMHIKDQPITTSELAKRRKVSLQSASVLVQGLVERGWLTREADPNDRRRSLLQVTPEGLAQAQTTHEQVTQLIAGILHELSSEELAGAAVFLPGLRRVVNAHMIPDPVLEK